MRAGLVLTLVFSLVSLGSTAEILVTVTNNAPVGGVAITPVWAGFHNGSFDSYDGGAASAAELERLAEDGNTGPISGVFGANGTLVSTGLSQTGTRVQGTLGGAPIAPGGSVSANFSIATDGTNRYFSYASMVLPSNDYYVANGNPLAHDLSALYGGQPGDSIIFNIGLPGTVNDAGTELNFENLGAGMTDTSVAGLGLLGGSYVGQSAPDTGTSEGGVNTNVAGDPFTPQLLAAHPELDFNDASLYPNGIATVSITVVPEPTSLLLIGMCGLTLLAARPWRWRGSRQG